MALTCNGDYREVGPYNQTMFLGCSIIGFDMNLGWSSEQGECKIDLIKDTAHHTADAIYNPLATLITTIDNNTVPAQTLSGASDQAKAVNKPIAKDLLNRSNITTASPGKSMWNGDSAGGQVFYTKPDPGFVGLDYDIIGTSAFFKFDAGLEFGGHIANWSAKGSRGGSPIYEVVLQSYAGLLSQSWLIVDKYVGTISSKVNGIAVPMLKTRDDFTYDNTGKVSEGNIPNIFNIYGYLESFGFGRSGKTSIGVNARQIYYALKDLAGGVINDFSPFGCIIGKHVTALDGTPVDTSSTIYGNGVTLVNHGLCPTIIANDGILRNKLLLDISEVPVPPADMYIEESQISITDFISRICDGAGYDWYASTIRSGGNYSAIIRIKTVNRRLQPPKDVLKNIITNLLSSSAKVSNYSYGQEYQSNNTARSIKFGGNQQRLLQVRSVHMATKQSCLVYDPFYNLGQGAFVRYGGPYVNAIRMPDAGSTRKQQTKTDGVSAVGQANTPSDFATLDSFGTASQAAPRGNYFVPQNIQTQVAPHSNVTGDADPSSYPLFYDLICPYFGNHGDDSTASGGTEADSAITFAEPRKVYWDRKMGQLQIIFRTNDITQKLSQPYASTGEFVVLENELRAAKEGFEPWIMYCFNSRFSTDIEQIMYANFRRAYPNLNTKGLFIALVQSISWETVNKSLDIKESNNQIGIENSIVYKTNIYNDLKKIHSFFAGIAGQYYGSSYMVRTPDVAWYSEGTVQAQLGSSYAFPGAGKIFTKWEIAADGAWEEKGNIIDDTMYVGSTAADFFSTQDGRIKAIAGFNGSAEFSSKDEWLNVYYGPAYTNNPWINLSMNLTKNRYISDAYWYYQLEHSIPADKYLYIKWFTPSLLSTRGGGASGGAFHRLTTSTGTTIPDEHLWKLYTEVEADPKILIWLNSTRIIIKTPSPIYLGGGKLKNENSLTTNQYHDLVVLLTRGYTTPSDVTTSVYTLKPLSITMPAIQAEDAAKAQLFMQEAAVQLGLVLAANGLSNDTTINIPFGKKATCPAFVAIPIKSNVATYGPWINIPGLEFDENLANNLVGGLKSDIVPDFVPWNYGGMDALDAAVMSQIKDDINYTQVAEKGTISLVGFMLANTDSTYFSLGNVLSNSANETGGPLLSRLSTIINENGISTSYEFRTYSRKIGFFNKQYADIAKDNNLKLLRRSRDFNAKISETINKTTNTFSSKYETINDQPLLGLIDRFHHTPKPLDTSPVEILCGQAYSHVNNSSSVTNMYDDIGFNPSWGMMPYTDNASADPKNYPRYLTSVGLNHVAELPREFNQSYPFKSMMSLDGILSPISYYPTPFGTTYHVTKYPRENCPVCKGQGTYTWRKPPNLSQNRNITLNTFMSNFTSASRACDFCEPSGTKNKKKFLSASPKETTPPYVLASGDDLQIISRNMGLSQSGLSGNPVINYSTYNPILLATGEFSCAQNRQNMDKTAHSIGVVAQGMTVPYTKQYSLAYAYSNNNPGDVVSNLDLVYSGTCAADNIVPETPLPANNMRYFGLRGPLMVHSWGYDIEGFPVPNASGEPKIVNGQYQYDADGNLLYRNQIQQIDGTWSKPYKEHQFYKGWGQLPSSWPVGPIDLRWDGTAGVWTVGANYKPVWILLETDLVEGNPSRGVIIDEVEYNNNPLPSGLRKLVFVKDSLRVCPAPRGAPIYCKYNSTNGFYEPIYNKPLIASGTIATETTADIYNLYQNTNETYNANFMNPLNYSVTYGDKGLFVYTSGGWVLQSANC